MILKIKKGVVRLLLGGVALGFLLSLPNLLEGRLESYLRLASWRTTLIKDIRENTDLHISIQGVYLDIFQGLVLKEIRVRSRDQSYEFHAENAVIKLSFLALYAQRLEFKSIYIEGAKLQMVSFDPDALQELTNSLSNFYEQTTNTYSQLHIPVFLDSLRVSLFKKQAQSALPSFIADFFLRPGKDAAAQKQGQQKVKIVLRSAGGERDTAWEMKLALEPGGKGDIQFQAVPVRIFTLLFNYYGWDKAISFLQKENHFRSDGFSGKGTLFSSAAEQRLSIWAKYKGLKIDTDSSFISPLQVRKADGEFRLNVLTRKKEKSQQNTTDFVLGIEQPGLTFNLTKKTLTAFSENTRRASLYTLKGKFSLDPQKSRLHLANMSGEIEFDLELHKEGDHIYPVGELIAKNLSIPLISANNKTKNKQAALSFERLSIHKKARGAWTEIAGFGTWLQAKLAFTGKGDFKFFSSSDDFRIEPKIDFDLSLEELSLQHFLHTIHNSYRSIRERGTKNHIRKRLEVERNEFLKSKLYKTLIAGLDLKANIYLRKIQAAYPFPKNLRLRAVANKHHLRVGLETDWRREKPFHAYLRYALYFQGSLPKHDLDFKLSAQQNKNALPILTGTQFPPEKIGVEYRYDGYGILPGDLIRRSYSYLQLNTSKLMLANKKMFRAIVYSSGLKQAELLVDELSVRRRSDGIHVDVYFAASSPQLTVNGSGDYSVGLGGNVSYFVRTQASGQQKLSQQKSNVRILASGKWIPDI